MKISICCPSYHRAQLLETPRYLPFVRVYIAKAEEEEYRKYNESVEFAVCPDDVQGNVSRVRNHILKREFEEGADVVLLIDDDLKGIFYWEYNRQNILIFNEVHQFIEKYSMLAQEWGARLWGINVNQDKQIYSEMTPFSTVSYLGSPFHCFLKGNECFYDERLPLKEDYDMTLQQINKYRIVMRVNKFFYVVRQSEQVGGCSLMRNLEFEKEQLISLQKKWGKQIVHIDTNPRSHNLRRRKVELDYNPVLYVPIKGV